MGKWGQIIGSALGSIGSALFPTFSNGQKVDSRAVGSQLGSLLPFKEGGLVPSRVFHSNAAVARRPKRNYQKSTKKKSSKRK